MERIREHIYLAALLHDIGKFYQRADTGSPTTSKFLNEINKVESTFLPLDKNSKYTHKHCLWTAQFIDDNKSVFKNLVGSDVSDLTNRNNLINLSAGHHLKAEQLSELGKIIQQADWLSSGMDRSSDEALKDDQNENNWDAFKKIRMTSILETISVTEDGKQEKEMNYHLPVTKLNLTKDFFPKGKFDSTPDYEKLWKEFEQEFKFIQANTYKAFSETLLNLLYKYTCNIPSSTINFPDVSLYDHLKTTAALAICLYDYLKEGKKGESEFLLVGADFSGIQNYIYQIISKYAGKNLKGRSFYLRILSDTVVRYLLGKLNLFQANVIYNSGGSFYLLAPNTPYTTETLQNCIKTIEEQMFALHDTSLYVAIDYVPLSADDLLGKNNRNLSNAWTDLFDKRSERKSARFSGLITENYEAFFEPGQNTDTNKRDAISGEEFGLNEKVFMSFELNEEFGKDNPIKEITGKQILLGKQLRDTTIMVIAEETIPYWKDKFFIEPGNLGLFYYFLERKDIEAMKDKLKASADKVSVITLNGNSKGECEFIQTMDGINNIYGFEFYGGNEYRDKTFEDMCKPGVDGNFSRLGVLRMDVDNLGLIFQKGLKSGRVTLSRYAALSRSFDYFFSGYINTVWKETEPDKSFIIYSGGDDVFIVGSWDTTIKLAKKIREEFDHFACKNKVFSLSGGIAFLPEKFPIMKAASESEIQEKLAKEHQIGDLSKNSLSFFDMPLNWDYEFKDAEELKDKIVSHVKKECIPKSFISKILSHHQNAAIEKNIIKNLKTYWMISYDMSRFKARTRDEEAKTMIDNLIKEACGNKKMLNSKELVSEYHPLELWSLAARWAELELRTN